MEHNIHERLNELACEYQLKSIKEVNDTSNSFIKTKRYQCILNNGTIFNREKIVKGNHDGHAVSIVPVTTDFKTILVVQPRVFTKTGIGVEIPAGYIDTGEEATTAALRELKEETGYVPSSLIPLASYYQDQGCSSAYIQEFLALDCERIYEQSLDRDEYIKFLECDIDEVYELLDEGIIEDANSIIALTRAREYIYNRRAYYENNATLTKNNKKGR